MAKAMISDAGGRRTKEIEPDEMLGLSATHWASVALAEAYRVMSTTEPCAGVVGENPPCACRGRGVGYHNSLTAFAHEPWFSQIPQFADVREALAEALTAFVRS